MPRALKLCVYVDQRGSEYFLPQIGHLNKKSRRNNTPINCVADKFVSELKTLSVPVVVTAVVLLRLHHCSTTMKSWTPMHAPIHYPNPAVRRSVTYENILDTAE